MTDEPNETTDSRIDTLRKYAKQTFSTTKQIASMVKSAFFLYVSLIQSVIIDACVGVFKTARHLRDGNLGMVLLNTATTVLTIAWLRDHAKFLLKTGAKIARYAAKTHPRKVATGAALVKSLAPFIIAAAALYAIVKVSLRLYNELQFIRFIMDELDNDEEPEEIFVDMKQNADAQN